MMIDIMAFDQGDPFELTSQWASRDPAVFLWTIDCPGKMEGNRAAVGCVLALGANGGGSGRSSKNAGTAHGAKLSNLRLRRRLHRGCCG